MCHSAPNNPQCKNSLYYAKQEFFYSTHKLHCDDVCSPGSGMKVQCEHILEMEHGGGTVSLLCDAMQSNLILYEYTLRKVYNWHCDGKQTKQS